MNYLIKVVTMMAIVFGVTFTISKADSDTDCPEATIDNLQKAIQVEGNGARKYIVYAEAAEREGYNEIADLFRAVAKSKAVQLRNHRIAIERLGGDAEKIRYDKFEPGSTLENLQEFIDEDAMYPEYIQTAKDENANIAMNSFTNSLIIECQQRSMAENAFERIQEYGAGNYYVDARTGETLDLPSATLPEERADREEYVKIN